MAKYNYESLKNSQQEKANTTKSSTKKDYPRVGYFSLWDEKPSAIVRFDVGSPDDLEIVDVHNTKLTKEDGTFAYRYVACLRDNDAPFKDCPLCAKDVKTRRTIVFVRMLEYRIGDDGKVVAIPVTWSRASTFADELVSLINDYGDLRELLFKVSREVVNGKTKFNVRLQPEMGIYTEAAGYVKDFSAFNNFMMNKHSYMERSFDELTEFVKTGVMASRKPKEEKTHDEEMKEFDDAISKQEYIEAPIPTNDEIPVNTINTQPGTQTINTQQDDNNPTTSRRRRYDFQEEEPFKNPF